MKQKLLVLTTTFPRWQNDPDPPFVYELVRRLAANFDVTVHAPHYPGAETDEEMEQIKVHRFRYFLEPFEKLAGSTSILPTLRQNKLYYGLLPFFLTAQFFSLFLLVRKSRPTIIHAHWILPQGFFAVMMKTFFGIPVVVTAHGADVYALQHSLFNAAKRFVLRRADKVTVVSSALREKIVHDICSVPAHIIPMGVCSETFAPGKQAADIKKKHGVSGKAILYVGRLSEKKGVRYLIDAMPAVLAEFPDAALLVIGTGELESELQKISGSKGLGDHVIFVGGVSNRELPAYYCGSDVFVGPSVQAQGGDTEGLGLTFVEAAMSGCLIIGSDVGGIGDVIENNKTGFLVPEKDSRAIAEKIIYALRNPNKVEELAEQGRKKCIEKFDLEVISKKYTSLIRAVTQ